MQKLEAVAAATQLMEQAREWSTWRWLFEKKRVRAAADHANEALSKLEKKVKAQWGDDLKTAYRELKKPTGAAVDPGLFALVKKVKDADDEAESTRLDAEATFDEAERVLSTDMAREETTKAIAAWHLREKAIRKAEALTRKAAAG